MSEKGENPYTGGREPSMEKKRIGTFTGIVIAMLVPFAIGMFFVDPSSEGTLGVLGAAWIWFVLSFVLYFLPTLIADQRNAEDTGMIFALNFLLGWTGLVWLIALVLAFVKPKKGARSAEIEAAVSAALQARKE